MIVEYLLALYFAPAYTLNRAALRFQVERTENIMRADKMASEIARLSEMELVEVLDKDTVRLTLRGEDVVLGRSQNHGVKISSPADQIKRDLSR